MRRALRTDGLRTTVDGPSQEQTDRQATDLRPWQPRAALATPLTLLLVPAFGVVSHFLVIQITPSDALCLTHSL